MDGNGNKLILPDSRLSDETVGSQMVDWPLPSGGTVRVEVVKIYCANCGKPYGYVPRDNCTFTFWLCGKCSEKWSDLAGTFAVPDEEFDKAVAAEMESRFGGALDDAGIQYHLERNEMGPLLQALMRDSPYPVPSKPGGA